MAFRTFIVKQQLLFWKVLNIKIFTFLLSTLIEEETDWFDILLNKCCTLCLCLCGIVTLIMNNDHIFRINHIN